MFVEGEEVIYLNMTGRISTITTHYAVMEMPPAPNRNPARVLIYHSDYSKVQREK